MDDNLEKDDILKSYAALLHDIALPISQLDAQLQRLAERLQISENDLDLQSSRRSLSRLKTYTDNGLILGKILLKQIRLQREEFSLLYFLNELRADFDALAGLKEQEIVINASTDISITADRLYLNRALSNLLLNALQHSPEKSAVQLNLSAKKAHNYLKLAVIDSGLGFDENQQIKLFEPFTRGEHNNNLSQSGLGLYIAKVIVESHGGTLTIGNILDKSSDVAMKETKGKTPLGGCLEITLPLATNSQ